MVLMVVHMWWGWVVVVGRWGYWFGGGMYGMLPCACWQLHFKLCFLTYLHMGKTDALGAWQLVIVFIFSLSIMAVAMVIRYRMKR